MRNLLEKKENKGARNENNLSSLIWRTAAESQCRVSRSSHGLWIFFYVCQHENDELHEECSAANASNSP
ncbi:hypothetical protein BHE74_00012150 [Ensete ventricosum]|nr:hypothetical protein BHE74_00012150 [Ensete ventricosum]